MRYQRIVEKTVSFKKNEHFHIFFIGSNSYISDRSKTAFLHETSKQMIFVIFLRTSFSIFQISSSVAP